MKKNVIMLFEDEQGQLTDFLVSMPGLAIAQMEFEEMAFGKPRWTDLIVIDDLHQKPRAVYTRDEFCKRLFDVRRIYWVSGQKEIMDMKSHYKFEEFLKQKGIRQREFFNVLTTRLNTEWKKRYSDTEFSRQMVRKASLIVLADLLRNYPLKLWGIPCENVEEIELEPTMKNIYDRWQAIVNQKTKSYGK